MVAAGAMPPVAEKTSGVKDPLSIDNFVKTYHVAVRDERLMEYLYYTYGSRANFLFLGPTALI